MKPHALVVDDEETICRVLKTFLTQSGFRVTTAGSSAAVQRELARQRFDLVTLDVDLGGEYGLGLMPVIGEADPPPPVIVYSGVGADSELANLALAKGAVAFVSKGDSLAVLGEAVRRAVPAAASAAGRGAGN